MYCVQHFGTNELTNEPNIAYTEERLCCCIASEATSRRKDRQKNGLTAVIARLLGT